MENIDTLSYIVSPSRLKTHQAKEALLPQPRIEWVVDQLISNGSVNVFVGAPATKKTFSLISMGICVAAGKPWIGFDVIPVNVLILDEDSGMRRLSQRVGDALRGEKLEDVPLQYTEPCGLNLRHGRDVDELKDMVIDQKIGLLIIDTLANIMPGADENSVKDTNPVFMALRHIAYETNCAIVLLHHTNKVGDYRGSTAIEAAVDSMIMVDSNDKSPEIKFKTIKSRDTKGFKFSAIIEFKEDAYSLRAPDEKSITDENLSPSKRAILNYLSTRPDGALHEEIAKNCSLFSKNTVKKVLFELIKLGLVIRHDDHGQGTDGIYGLPVSQNNDAK